MNNISYAKSTFEKAKQFQKMLKELENQVSMPEIRAYALTGKKKSFISEDLYSSIDQLLELRRNGISGEMKYAKAQAESNGIDLPEDIVTGISIKPGFSQAVLNKIPSLGIYEHFMLFTEKELDEYLNSNKVQKESTPKKMDFPEVDEP